MRGITGWGGNLQSNSVRSWVLVSEEGEEEIIETQGVEQYGDGVGDGGVVLTQLQHNHPTLLVE